MPMLNWAGSYIVPPKYPGSGAPRYGLRAARAGGGRGGAGAPQPTINNQCCTVPINVCSVEPKPWQPPAFALVTGDWPLSTASTQQVSRQGWEHGSNVVEDGCYFSLSF
eukprot:scaffold5043_cov115-Isochrysis_galbana.AAC.11